MKIILDECVPAVVKAALPHRDITTVQLQGWSGVKNGRLLQMVTREFDIFITSDKNLRFQQNLTALDIAIILLPSNQVPVVAALVPVIDSTIGVINRGEFIAIS